MMTFGAVLFDDDDVFTQRGESQGKTKKERKATKSKGRGLEEGG